MWWGRYAYRSRSPLAVTPLNTRAVSTPASMPDKMSVEMLSPMITVSSGLLPACMYRKKCEGHARQEERYSFKGQDTQVCEGTQDTLTTQNAKHGTVHNSRCTQRNAVCTLCMEGVVLDRSARAATRL
jgi:hypothetical protein